MALADIFVELYAKSMNDGQPQEYTLGQGLRLRASWVDGLRRLLLIRPSVFPSENEVKTCAEHAGILHYTTTQDCTKSGCWILITELAGDPLREKLITEIVTEKGKRDSWWKDNCGPWIETLRAMSDAELQVAYTRNVLWHRRCKKCGREPRPEPVLSQWPHKQAQPRDPPSPTEQAWQSLGVQPEPEQKKPIVTQSSLFSSESKV